MFLQTGDSEIYTPPDKAVIASLAFHPTDHVLLIATCNKLYFWSWGQAEPFACVQTASAEEKVRYYFYNIFFILTVLFSIGRCFLTHRRGLGLSGLFVVCCSEPSSNKKK